MVIVHLASAKFSFEEKFHLYISSLIPTSSRASLSFPHFPPVYIKIGPSALAHVREIRNAYGCGVRGRHDGNANDEDSCEITRSGLLSPLSPAFRGTTGVSAPSARYIQICRRVRPERIGIRSAFRYRTGKNCVSNADDVDIARMRFPI